ncbi:MAG: hypothetical protein ACI8ZM_002934 [Crocinitomix sp.]|jgi:hypothetical protein
MKLLLISIFFAFLPADNWIDEANIRINIVDSKAKLIKEKPIYVDQEWSGTYSSFKLKKERLIFVEAANSTSV